MKKSFLLIVAFFSFLTLSFAQTGKVTGNIKDGDFNDALAFANVLVKGTTTGTTSDFDGNYTLDLDPGNYTLVFSFVGYETQEISDVTITANGVTDLNITLNTNSLDTVVITTTARKNTENAVLDIQRKSATVLDGLSAQSIKKSGASNLASAVKSIPGVSVQGGKYVYVRGLGDRYTKSILNGMDIPGLDPDRNTIQMDIFPTNILDNIVVLKSAAAEYPADFTGGIVDIVTKDFPTKREYTLSIGAGYNPDMHFNNNYLNYNGSSTDFLGFDNGDRKRAVNRNQRIPGTFENSYILTYLTNNFNKELSAKKNTSAPNFSLGFTAGNQYEVGDNKLGYQASLSYKNNTKFYEGRKDGTYTRDENNPNNYELLGTRLTVGNEGINEVLLNGMAGLTYKRERAKYKLNILHIQNGESSAGYFSQQIAQAGGGSGFEPVFKDALKYTQRAVTNVLLHGKHNFEGNWIMNWKLSPTLSKVEDKDHRITPLALQDDGNYVISPSTSSFPIRIWRELEEYSLAGKIDMVKKYDLFDRGAKLKFGTAYTLKNRDFSIDDYTFTSTNLVVANGIADNLLLEENIWTPENQSGTHLVFGDEFNPNDAYIGEQRNMAIYASNEFKPFEKFKAIIGLRAEKFEHFYTGVRGNLEFNNDKIIDKFDLFPSANLIYNLTDDQNIRGSISRTTARPSFKEASNAAIFDAITNRLFIGNLDLKPTYVNNFDLRYENFLGKGEMFAVSGFYKKFSDPIELTFFASAPDQLTPANLGDANVLGLEFEFRKNLGFIVAGLENLNFNVNASFIKSSLEMSDAEYNNRVLAARTGESVKRTRDLQGQSPFIINTGLNYDHKDSGLQAGLFYNMQESTLDVVGTGIVPDVYTKPFHSINFTFSKAFGQDKKSAINLKATNILGESRDMVYKSFQASEQIFSSRNPGREFSVGYSYKF